MKIGDTKTVTGVTRTRRESAVRSYSRAGGARPGAAVSDTASVMGIPETELTPKVRAAIMALMEEVDHLRQELSRSQARLVELERLADQDTLAPVPNRRAFVRELTRVISYSQRYGAPSSLIYFDVNGFKRINDSHGHAAGDAALLHVAATLMQNVRESDTVGRLGGDEFGVILAQADERTARDKALSLSEQINTTPVPWDGESFSISVSYGTTTFQGDESVEEALDAADRAMYRHKAGAKTAT